MKDTRLRLCGMPTQASCRFTVCTSTQRCGVATLLKPICVYHTSYMVPFGEITCSKASTQDIVAAAVALKG